MSSELRRGPRLHASPAVPGKSSAPSPRCDRLRPLPAIRPRAASFVSPTTPSSPRARLAARVPICISPWHVSHLRLSPYVNADARAAEREFQRVALVPAPTSACTRSLYPWPHLPVKPSRSGLRPQHTRSVCADSEGPPLRRDDADINPGSRGCADGDVLHATTTSISPRCPPKSPVFDRVLAVYTYSFFHASRIPPRAARFVFPTTPYIRPPQPPLLAEFPSV
ncbi:hypothetical protein BKA93DRAFT_342211 [Sparassis latifolia]